MVKSTIVERGRVRIRGELLGAWAIKKPPFRGKGEQSTQVGKTQCVGGRLLASNHLNQVG
jgi:hypothetical protein